MRVLALTVLGLAVASASAAEFAAPVRVTGGGYAVRVESPGYAAPCLADINGDGKKDLLVGQFSKGKIRYHSSYGNGKFAAGDWLKAEGKVAEVPGVWWCTSSTPQFVDIDGDGNKDILSGSYSRMQREMAGLFQVLYGKKDGTFKSAKVLTGDDGEPLIIPIKDRKYQTQNICTRPFACDWNSDGKLDLVVGNFAGTFYWFEGKGKGKFAAKPEKIKARKGDLRIQGAHSDPFVIDWDGDGDLDLLSGSSSGGVQIAENTAGEKAMPKFSGFKSLIAPGRGISYGEILKEKDLKGPTMSTRIWVDDVNNDGKLDILVGDSVTLISPANGLSVEEFKKKQAEWQKEYQRLQKLLQKGADQKTIKKFNAMYQKRGEFINEDRTGFVWLYVQQ